MGVFFTSNRWQQSSRQVKLLRWDMQLVSGSAGLGVLVTPGLTAPRVLRQVELPASGGLEAEKCISWLGTASGVGNTACLAPGGGQIQKWFTGDKCKTYFRYFHSSSLLLKLLL